MANHIRLVGYTLAAPIERIRGGNICVQITAEFAVTTGSTTEFGISVPGVAIVQEENKIQDGIKEAVNNAWRAVQDLVDLAPKPVVSGANSGTVLRVMLEPAIKQISAKSTPDKLAEHNVPASAALQKRVTDLCQVLGIDPIEVEGQWTSMEVAALLLELNRASTKITKVAE